MLPLLRSIAFLALFLVSLSSAFALDPAIDPAGYRHDRWSEVDGHPNMIDALAQTDDGWLWLASRRTGLYRFDGVRFIALETRDGSRLQQVGVSVLQPGPDNTLWVGHGRGGVSVLQDFRLRHLLTPEQTGSVYAIAHGAGATWVASNRGLFEIRNGAPVRVGSERGYASLRGEYVMADGQGRVWASDGAYLYLLERGAAAFRRVRPVQNDPMLIEAADGSVWLVLGKRFERLRAPAAALADIRRPQGNTYQSAFDKHGNLWSGNCPVGVCVVRPDAGLRRQSFDALASRERLGKNEQLTGLTILSVLADREGNLWIGTTAGLDRLRDQPVHMVPELFDIGAVQALPHPAGGMLVLATQRLNGDLALWRMSGEKLVSVPNPLNVHKMARAPDGSLVLAGAGGIERHHADHSERIALPPVSLPPGTSMRLRSLAAGNDELWCEVIGHGTWRYRAGSWSRFAPADPAAVALAADAGGRAWISVRANQLQLVSGDSSRTIPAAPGVDLGDIKYIHAGDEVLVAGSRGYGMVRNGRIEALQVDTADGIGAFRGMVRGADGAYWLNASKGLLRVEAGAWRRTMQDLRVPLQGQLFDALDGYTGGGETIWLTDTAFFAPDGKLWLAGERGLAWLDPAALERNAVRTEVDILEVRSGGRRFDPALPVELGKGEQDLQIAYSAPSLKIPQRVRFRYRMLGADKKWEDAGTRRTAFYSKLAPGRYVFEVVAINDSGLPSARAARLHITIAPRLTQTWWFYALCIGAGGMALYLVYRLRLRHLAARLEERFNIRTNERESVARALHDSFLQSLQGLLFSMQAVVTGLPAGSAPRREFDGLLERAREVLAEGRDEVMGLRSEFRSSEEFWNMLLRDVDLVAREGRARVRLAERAKPVQFSGTLHHNVYAIVREAVFNALRHTDGPVAVAATRDTTWLVFSVTDQGGGLGVFRKGKPGHYGLQGMGERAAQIGARLEFVDAEGGGTRVVLSIPSVPALDDRVPPFTATRSDGGGQPGCEVH